MGDSPHVQLGRHSVPVYEQPWRRVVKRLGGVLDALRASGEDLDTEDLVRSLDAGGRLYEALVTFIPALPKFLPEYEFNGYTSPEAWRNDEYDEAADTNTDGTGGIAPTFPQFLDAFDVIVEVNGGKRFIEALGKVFDPKMLKAEASLALSEWRERASIGSPSSPITSGASLPSSSTTTPPTPEKSSGASEIGSLDFAPRSQWEPSLSS